MSDELKRRLNAVANHDWRISFLAHTSDTAFEAVEEIARLTEAKRQAEERAEKVEAENMRLRAALAQSERPCVYCSLPADEWAKCQSGFPGCARADDAMGCPELGARMECDEFMERARLAEAQAEGMRAVVDAARKARDLEFRSAVHGQNGRERQALMLAADIMEAYRTLDQALSVLPSKE